MNDDRPKRSTRDERRADRPPAGTSAAGHRAGADAPPPPEQRPVANAAPTPTVTPPSPAARTELLPEPEVRALPSAAPQLPATEPTPEPRWIKAEPPPPPGADPVATAEEPWAALVEAQAALARGFEEIAGELTGLTRSGLTATTDAAIALLGARTLAEIVEINAGWARRGVDAMIDGSAKLSEISVKAMSQASRPILSRLGSAWGDIGAR